MVLPTDGRVGRRSAGDVRARRDVGEDVGVRHGDRRASQVLIGRRRPHDVELQVAVVEHEPVVEVGLPHLEVVGRPRCRPTRKSLEPADLPAPSDRCRHLDADRDLVGGHALRGGATVVLPGEGRHTRCGVQRLGLAGRIAEAATPGRLPAAGAVAAAARSATSTSSGRGDGLGARGRRLRLAKRLEHQFGRVLVRRRVGRERGRGVLLVGRRSQRGRQQQSRPTRALCPCTQAAHHTRSSKTRTSDAFPRRVE